MSAHIPFGRLPRVGETPTHGRIIERHICDRYSAPDPFATPTANLDPAGMAEIFAVLERLNREAGTTIVMVEHRVDELADRVSRVLMMDCGSIVFDGTPREAFSQRWVAHSEENAAVPTSAWFPQACEFALALGDRMGRPVCRVC